MTINCVRWQDIAFSAVYYLSGQKLLVRKDLADQGVDTVAELSGLRVCAPRARPVSPTSREQAPDDTEIVTAVNHTQCLVKFQRGEADAITGDDTVLAGLAAQDPYAVVPTGQRAFTAEPYGIGVNKDKPDLVRFINAVLEQMRADGTWEQSYNTWLRPGLGAGTGQPQPSVRRPAGMTVAPVAPGSIGSAIEPAAIQAYVGALDDWLRGRKTELDELDAAALAANRGGQVAGDMMLSMALWKAVSERYQLIFATWDGGRVLEQEREKHLLADLGTARRSQRTARRHGRLGARGVPPLGRPGRPTADSTVAGARRGRVGGPDQAAARTARAAPRPGGARTSQRSPGGRGARGRARRPAGRGDRQGPARRRRRGDARRRSRSTPPPASAT